MDKTKPFRSVKSQFSLIYTGFVFLIVILGVISIHYLVQIGGSISGLITTNYNSITRLTEMRNALTGQNANILQYLYTSDKSYFDEIEDAGEQFMHFYERERETIIIPEELVYITNISTYYGYYFESVKELFALPLHTPANREAAFSYFENRLKEERQVLENEITLLFVSNEEALFARKIEASDMVRTSTGILFIIFLFSALASFFLASLWTVRVFAPIREITETVRLVRQGFLNRKAVINRSDEFGMLAEEFNNMTGRLDEFEKSTMGSLMAERNKADSIVRSIEEPLMVLDAGLRIMVLNKAFAQLFPLSDLDITGKPLAEVIPDSDFIGYVREYNVSKGLTVERVIEIERDGENLFYQATFTPMKDQNAEFSGLIVSLHNITEIKQLEKARGNFLATVSHEFKTPLTSIVMGIDLMNNEMVGKLNSEQTEILETVREDTQRLQMLTEELLELSRIESAKMLYHFTACNIVEIIDTSLKQFFKLAERNGVRLTSYFPRNLPPVRADASKITWVLNNLLSNAIKYTRRGDSIHVTCSTGNRYMSVTVTDTGVGIPEGFSDQLFQKFVQVKGSEIEVRGTGVGLAVSKEIITAHGGTIQCKSKVLKGSTFIFTLELMPS